MKDRPNESGDTLESVVIEFRITGILRDLLQDPREVRKDGSVNRSESLSRRDDDSHNRCSVYVNVSSSLLSFEADGSTGQRREEKDVHFIR